MAKILAPNKSYTGMSASVAFCNGVGETDDKHLIDWFKKHGYEVVEEKEETLPKEETEEVPSEETPKPKGKGKKSTEK